MFWQPLLLRKVAPSFQLEQADSMLLHRYREMLKPPRHRSPEQRSILHQWALAA